METDIDVTLPVAAQPSVEAIVDQAQMAEQLGYNNAWLPETWGREAASVLTTLAIQTNRIGIGSSIVNVYARSPALIGQMAATIQEISDGRYRVGLGPSGPVLIENWHGIPFEQPLRRTREYIEIVSQATSGEQLEYDGSLFDLSGFHLRFDPPENRPPVDVAAMGPKTVELAGRFADGWHGLLLTRSGIEDRIEDLERGATLGNRDVSDVRTMVSVPCCALADGERARHLVRQHIAFYIGGMGTYYRDSLVKQGYDPLAHEIYDAWNNGEREDAVSLITDELIDELAAAGTPEETRSMFQRFAEIDGLDAVSVRFPRGATLEEIEDTMRNVAPVNDS